MLDAKQIRAARALLDWTQETLAERSGIARATIKNVESGITLPRLETANALQSALEEGGVDFLSSSGVRMKDRVIQTYEGETATQMLLDDVYNTLKDSGTEVLIAHVDETIFIKNTSASMLSQHLDRLAKAGIKERMLVRRDEKNLVAPLEAYRLLPDKYLSKYPLFIYGNKLAMACWTQPKKSIVINDERFAEAARKLFEFIWERTEMPSHKNPEKL